MEGNYTMAIKMMRVIGIALLFFGFTFAQRTVGKITFPLGDNFLQRAGDLQWNPVQYYMPVHNQDRIKTGKQSRCEVTFTNKKVMRIGENSIVQIKADDSGTEKVEMNRGRAWISLFLPKGKSHLIVKTPTSVCAIRGTVYRLESDSNQTTYRCYQGELEITPMKKDRSGLADTSIAVGAGEELILVMNFEQYKKQQEKEFQNYQKQQMDEFEQFIKKDQQEFKKMVEQDLADFRRMKAGLAFKKDKFDQQADANSDWVQWNKERDKLLQEQ
ncbi:hypothetical protein DRI50_05665 [candidate division KSB1 bacterium]|nr:MAG: hypothetical protein DRI50_05665 [candidate division KSB1 bacterium]